MKVIKSFFKGLFSGAAIGFVATFGVYLLCFGLEILNCACDILSCDLTSSDSSSLFPGLTFGAIALWCTGIGTVIGGLWGLIAGFQEQEEATELQQQENYADCQKNMTILVNQYNNFKAQTYKAANNLNLEWEKQKKIADNMIAGCKEGIQVLKEDMRSHLE